MLTDSFTLPYTRIRVRATLDRVEADAVATLRALETQGFRLYRRSDVKREAEPWDREGTIDLALIPPGVEVSHA